MEQKACHSHNQTSRKPDIWFYLPILTASYEHQGLPADEDDISVTTEIIEIIHSLVLNLH